MLVGRARYVYIHERSNAQWGPPGWVGMAAWDDAGLNLNEFWMSGSIVDDKVTSKVWDAAHAVNPLVFTHTLGPDSPSKGPGHAGVWTGGFAESNAGIEFDWL